MKKAKKIWEQTLKKELFYNLNNSISIIMFSYKFSNINFYYNKGSKNDYIFITISLNQYKKKYN